MPSTLDRPEKQTLPPQAQEAWKTLETRVDGVRRRHRTKFIVSGVCVALAVLFAAFLGFSLVDILFKLSVGSRVFWLAMTTGGVLAALFLAVIRPLSRLGGQVPMAREVERSYPELEEQLSTAIEYGRGKAEDGTSPELVGALIAQAKNRSDNLDFTRTVHLKRAGIAALIAFLISAAVGVYASVNPRLFATTWSRFFNPTARVAPPTMTSITSVERLEDGKPVPVDGEVAVETTVPLLVTLDGRVPDQVTLSVLTGEGKDAHWDDRLMDRGEDGLYRASLRRLLNSATFKVKAGDAESDEYTINVFREPQIDEFTVQLDYPKYTGKAPELLPPGQGDIRALKGTQVTVRFKSSAPLGAGQVNFSSGRPPAPAAVDGRQGVFTFTVDTSDHYQVAITDQKGRSNKSPTSYQVTALKDLKPSVVIRKPARDLMVHREQTVKIEITANDDVGVGEIGIFHSLGLEEKKTMVKRFDPAPTRGEGTLTWDLANLNLKGGEVIAYYAYALDNNTIDGPKIAKSEIQFLTIYDEEEYDAPQQPGGPPPTPQSVKNLDKMIEIQKKLLQETFTQARLRDIDKPADERAKTAATKTAEDQRTLRGQLHDLIAEVKKEMEQAANGDAPPQGAPQENPLGEKELKLMNTASEKMEAAAKELDEAKATGAVNPEIEALRNLSETRRILLSDKEGDPRFKQAMQNQSKKKKKSQQQQEQQDQQAAREEMAQLPPMMEREKEAERDLEKLEDVSKKQPPQGTPKAEEQKQAERQLKRETQNTLDQLKKDAEEREKSLRELAKRNPDLNPAADKMQQAGEKIDQAQKKLDQDKLQEAKDLAHEAGREMKDAQRSIRDQMDKQLRQELANLQQDAQELAQKQEQMAQASREMQRQQEQGGQKPEQGEPKSGQQPKPGDEKSGQQPSDQQQSGEEKSGQQPGGEPKSGGQPDEKSMRQMASMGKRQSELAQDMKDLAERLSKASERASNANMPGADALKQAESHTSEQSPGQQSAQKAAANLEQGKAGEAEREQHKSTRALDAAARSVQEAIQKAEAADMQALADAMRKAQALKDEQNEINKGIGEKHDPAKLADKQEKIGEAAKDLASATEKLDTLKRQGRAGSAKEQLNRAAEQAKDAARALNGQDSEKAKDPAAKAEKALESAFNEMERAAGKTLQDKTKDAQELARATREKQEKAATSAKTLPDTKPGEKMHAADAAKRDEAAADQRDASRNAQKLEKMLEGLEEMAKEANPAAAQAASDARTTAEEAKLPSAMEDLAKEMEKIGDPKQTAESAKSAPTPQESGKKGDQLAATVKKIEGNLKDVMAQASKDMEAQLKAMEEAAKEAQKKADAMAQSKEGDPKESKEGKSDPSKPGEQKNDAANLENDLNRLESRLGQLEPNAPEMKELKNAQQKLSQAKADAEKADPNAPPSENKKQLGGPAFRHVSKSMEKIATGLMERRERILKAREVSGRSMEGEAPKEYNSLVEKYSTALSNDSEDKK